MSKKSIFVLLGTVVMDVLLFAGQYEEKLNEAEKYIKAKYPNTESLAAKSIKAKLNKIHESQISEPEKIKRINCEILGETGELLTEKNASKLLYNAPYTITIEKPFITFMVNQSEYFEFSSDKTFKNFKGAETRTIIDEKTREETGAEGNVRFIMSNAMPPSTNAQYQIKGSTISMDGQTEERKNTVMSEESYATCIKTLKQKKITDCFIKFSIEIKNNIKENLTANLKNSRIPVKLNNQTLLHAELVGNNRPKNQIRYKSELTLSFEGKIVNTKAMELLKSFNIEILPQKAQELAEHLEYDDKTIKPETDLYRIRYFDNFWEIRKIWNGKMITLRQALWAVNAKNSDKKAFVFDVQGYLTTIAGKPIYTVWKDKNEQYMTVLLKKYGAGNSEYYTQESLNAQLDKRFETDEILIISKNIVDLLNDQQCPKEIKDKIRPHLRAYETYVQALVEYKDKQYVKAFTKFIQTAKSADAKEKFLPECYYQIATCYLNGTGTNKNIEQSKKYFVKAADCGYMKASYELGKIYKQEGKIDLAIKHFENAIDLDEAKLELGEIYINPKFGRKNRDKARILLKPLKEKGNKRAQWIWYDERLDH